LPLAHLEIPTFTLDSPAIELPLAHVPLFLDVPREVPHLNTEYEKVMLIFNIDKLIYMDILNNKNRHHFFVSALKWLLLYATRIELRFGAHVLYKMIENRGTWEKFRLISRKVQPYVFLGVTRAFWPPQTTEHRGIWIHCSDKIYMFLVAHHNRSDGCVDIPYITSEIWSKIATFLDDVRRPAKKRRERRVLV